MTSSQVAYLLWTSEFYCFSIHLPIFAVTEGHLSRTLCGRALNGTGDQERSLWFPVLPRALFSSKKIPRDAGPASAPCICNPGR